MSGHYGSPSYWARRIGEAKERYNAWCQWREPKGANHQDWQKWHAWRMARIEYFNTERSKLYGYSAKRRVTSTSRAGYLTALADKSSGGRGHARS